MCEPRPIKKSPASAKEARPRFFLRFCCASSIYGAEPHKGKNMFITTLFFWRRTANGHAVIWQRKGKSLFSTAAVSSAFQWPECMAIKTSVSLFLFRKSTNLVKYYWRGNKNGAARRSVKNGIKIIKKGFFHRNCNKKIARKKVIYSRRFGNRKKLH